MSDRRSAVIEWRTLIVASDLPPSARLVAFVLSTHMDANGGSCFPSVDTIARESGRSRRTVQYALDAIEQAGLVHRTRGGGRGHSSRYRVKGVTVAPFSGERVQPATRKGAVVAPEDVQEDVHNPSTRANARGRKGRARGARPTAEKPATRKWTQ